MNTRDLLLGLLHEQIALGEIEEARHTLDVMEGHDGHDAEVTDVLPLQQIDRGGRRHLFR